MMRGESKFSESLGDVAIPQGLIPSYDAERERQVTEAEAELSPSQEVVANAQEFYDGAKTDMNLFAALCAPEDFTYLFPERFLAIWQWLLSYAFIPRIFPRLVLGLPRGFAKTTILQLFIAYCVAYTEKQYCIIFAAIPELSKKVLKGAMSIILGENFQAIYGQVTFEKETQEEVQFWFKGRLVIIQASSAGAGIRGTNVDRVRPDLIIFDDIQKREDSKSPILGGDIKDWFQNTALKLRSPKGCMYVFLGNMYPTEHSMLRWLCRQASWVKFVTGAILADGTSLWEELFPIKQLLEEYKADAEAGMASSFMAELMNDEHASLNTQLDTTKLSPYTNPYGLAPMGKFIIIDPSTGRAGKDAVGIGQLEVYEDKPILCKLDLGAFSPGETIKRALAMAAETNTRLIFVEAVAYQETLLYWFEHFAKELGLHDTMVFLPIHPGSSSKNSRIVDMFRAWMAGELGVGPDCWTAALSQATSFDVRSQHNTDEILDIMHYGPKVVAVYGDYLAEQVMIEINAIEPPRVLSVEESSAF